MTEHRFKLGMYLPELGLPFDDSLAKAREIGADYVWFNTLGADGPSIAGAGRRGVGPPWRAGRWAMGWRSF